MWNSNRYNESLFFSNIICRLSVKANDFATFFLVFFLLFLIYTVGLGEMRSWYFEDEAFFCSEVESIESLSISNFDKDVFWERFLDIILKIFWRKLLNYRVFEVFFDFWEFWGQKFMRKLMDSRKKNKI